MCLSWQLLENSEQLFTLSIMSNTFPMLSRYKAPIIMDAAAGLEYEDFFLIEKDK